jgi:hypothetical protein
VLSSAGLSLESFGQLPKAVQNLRILHSTYIAYGYFYRVILVNKKYKRLGLGTSYLGGRDRSITI